MSTQITEELLETLRGIKDGKEWEFENANGEWISPNESFSIWDYIYSGNAVRLKPWSLSRHIPGFRPLEDGEEWHRNDFTEEMLPEGWRPLLNGESKQAGDLYFGSHCFPATNCDAAGKGTLRCKTQRPLPPVKKEPEWFCWRRGMCRRGVF